MSKKTQTRGRKAQKPAPEPELDVDEFDEELEDVDAEGGADTDDDDDEASDNVGDISVEVNVEELIAQIESESRNGAGSDGSARRRIEDILESKRIARELMDLEDLDLDD